MYSHGDKFKVLFGHKYMILAYENFLDSFFFIFIPISACNFYSFCIEVSLDFQVTVCGNAS